MTEDDYDLVVFDLEGTLCHTRTGGPFRKSADDWELYPDVLDRLAFLKERGSKIALASNQGGVAFGHLPAGPLHAELRRLAKAVGADDWRWCFHHPDGTVAPYNVPCRCRKPGPDMLLELMKEAGAAPGRTLMVGDREEDQRAAIRAGCGFIWASDYFGRSDPEPSRESAPPAA